MLRQVRVFRVQVFRGPPKSLVGNYKGCSKCCFFTYCIASILNEAGLELDVTSDFEVHATRPFHCPSSPIAVLRRDDTFGGKIQEKYTNPANGQELLHAKVNGPFLGPMF